MFLSDKLGVPRHNPADRPEWQLKSVSWAHDSIVEIEQGRVTATGNGVAHQHHHTLLCVFPHRPGLHRLRRERGDHHPPPIAGERNLGRHGHARSEVLDRLHLPGACPPRRGPPPVVPTEENGSVSCFVIATTERTTDHSGEPTPLVPSFTIYARSYAPDINVLRVFSVIAAPREIPIPRTTSRTRLRWLRYCSALCSGCYSRFVSITPGLCAGAEDIWNVVTVGRQRHLQELPYQRGCFNKGELGPIESLRLFHVCILVPTV